MWKDLVKYFEVISQGLAWKVGRGNSLRVGRDPCVGETGQHLLPQNPTDRLHERGIYHLIQIVDERHSLIWSQGWQDEQVLNLEEPFIAPWNKFIRALKLSHNIIKDKGDELIWNLSPFGVDSPKEGYSYLSYARIQ